jgi:hypothetical protein
MPRTKRFLPLSSAGAPSETVYKGASWTARYLGARTDGQLYLGAGTLR